jgi:hypothetical protein
MNGKHAWLESGVLDLGLTDQAFQTRSLVQLRAQMQNGESARAAGA